jgi:hypothetical protein
MAEEKTGKKWEDAGEPTGEGGTGKKEQTEAEVGGRAYIMALRGACGHVYYVDSGWSWARCPICGVVTFAWR